MEVHPRLEGAKKKMIIGDHEYAILLKKKQVKTKIGVKQNATTSTSSHTWP